MFSEIIIMVKTNRYLLGDKIIRFLIFFPNLIEKIITIDYRSFQSC